MGRGMPSKGVLDICTKRMGSISRYDILRLGIGADTEHIQVPAPKGSGTGSALLLEAGS